MATRDGVMLKQASSMKGPAGGPSARRAARRSAGRSGWCENLPHSLTVIAAVAAGQGSDQGVLNSPRVTLRLCLSITTPLLMSTAENQPVGVHTVRKNRGIKVRKGDRGRNVQHLTLPGNSQASPFDSIAWRIKSRAQEETRLRPVTAAPSTADMVDKGVDLFAYRRPGS